MSTDVAIINEVTEQVIASLSGVVGLTHLYDGRVTAYATSDRASRTDGTIDLPERITMVGVLSVTGSSQAAVEAARQSIINAKLSATPVSIQVPGRAPVVSMQIERCSFDTDRTRDTPFTIDLVERLIARSRTVSLSPIRRTGAANGGPRGDLAAGVAEEEDHGTRPTNVSLAVGFGNTVRSYLP